jgi:hypothetical protein
LDIEVALIVLEHLFDATIFIFVEVLALVDSLCQFLFLVVKVVLSCQNSLVSVVSEVELSGVDALVLSMTLEDFGVFQLRLTSRFKEGVRG